VLGMHGMGCVFPVLCITEAVDFEALAGDVFLVVLTKLDMPFALVCWITCRCECVPWNKW